jgi:FkbM family methyltransferase
MKLSRIITAAFSGGLKGHFGQYAEDVIVRKLFPHNTTLGRYLDVGAYHPFKHSNTAFFWLRGWTGVNVDANPRTIELFRKYRGGDTNIWAALVPEGQIAAGLKSVELLLPRTSSGKVEISGIGTVDIQQATNKEELKKISVPAKSINEIVKTCGLQELDLLSIDIEGYDEIVLKDFDFSYCAPKVIVVEDFSESFERLITSGITTFLIEKDYKLIGRAGWSSVFSYRGKTF